MPESSILALTESILGVIGAGIGFSVGYIALKGYRETGSPAFLRLAAAFFMLFVGFLVSALVGSSVVETSPGTPILLMLIPAQILPLLIVAAASFEAVGYFFLAFSHVVNVRAGGALPLLFIPLFTVEAALKSLSMYFLFYGFLETTIGYLKSRRAVTLGIAIGLGLLGFGELLRWMVFLFPPGDALLAASVGFKVSGLSTLLVPVLQFALRQDTEKMIHV